MANKIIPKVRKKISSFIKDEKGSISKQSLLSLGTFVGTIAVSSLFAVKDVKSGVAQGDADEMTVSHSHHGSHSSHSSHSSHCNHGSHGSHSSHGSHGSHSNY